MNQALVSFLSAAAAGLLCTAPALAQTAPEEAGLSRAQVQAELRAAQARGEVAALTAEDSGSAWLAARQAPGRLTRAEVVQQVMAARRAGELGVLTTEDSGSAWLARHGDMSRQATGLAAATR